MKHYDIVIVGAGIAGSALAASLSQLTVGRPLTIAIVERRPVPQGSPPLKEDVSGFDLRASALTNATIQWLDKIGAWPEVKNQRASAFAEMDVWVEEGTGHIHFSAGEVGESALGEIVENRVLTSTLLNMARGSPNVTVIDDVEVTGLELLAVSGQPQAEGSAQTVTLQLADGSAISAALVVAADGAASPVRTMSNIPVRAWDYGQDGIVCTVISEKPHRATAYQRFTRYGPVAFLPFEIP